MQRNKNNYWNLYVKNSEFDFYRDNIYYSDEKQRLIINKDIDVYNSLRVNNSDGLADMYFDFNNNQARIRIGGTGDGVFNGLVIQTPGDFTELKVGYNGTGTFTRGLYPFNSNCDIGNNSSFWRNGHIHNIHSYDIRNHGRNTINTNNSYTNYWLEVGVFTLTSQYNDASVVLECLDKGSGNTSPVYANLVARVKQQNPLGQAPYCSLYFIGGYCNTNASSWKMVVIENSTSKTVVKLYYCPTITYSQLTTGITRITTSGGVFTLSDQASPLASLPSGTQIGCSFMPIITDSIISRGMNPHSNNGYDLGTSSNRWRTVYAVNALNTSDERYKENIEYVDTKRNDETKEFYEFYKNDFKLATYNYVGQEHKEYGFIAQDFANSSIGRNLVINSEEGYMYSIGSYISSIAGALQHEIKLRDKQIEELVNKVSSLENFIKEVNI